MAKRPVLQLPHCPITLSRCRKPILITARNVFPLRTPYPALQHRPPGTHPRPAHLLNPPSILHHSLFRVNVHNECVAQTRRNSQIVAPAKMIPYREEPIPIRFKCMAEDMRIRIFLRNGLMQLIQQQLTAFRNRSVGVPGRHVHLVHVHNRKPPMSLPRKEIVEDIHVKLWTRLPLIRFPLRKDVRKTVLCRGQLLVCKVWRGTLERDVAAEADGTERQVCCVGEGEWAGGVCGGSCWLASGDEERSKGAAG